MNNYVEIAPVDFERSAFKLIGDEWMLITAPDSNKESGANAMTASWGGIGVLWNTPVATIYVRPQRHTYSLVENCDRLSLCFFSSEYKKALGFCGRASGRDTDKLNECGFTCHKEEGVDVIDQANTVMVCKKLYADDLKEACFTDNSPLACYPKRDYHRFYICEIEKVLIKE